MIDFAELDAHHSHITRPRYQPRLIRPTKLCVRSAFRLILRACESIRTPQDEELTLPSLRAQRSNPDCRRGGILDCFVASLLAMMVLRGPRAQTHPPHAEEPAKGGRLEGSPRARTGPSWFSRRCEASSGDARSAPHHEGLVTQQ